MPPEPQDPQQPHKRRVRYRGTHPRRFEEKYKELDPDKFADDVKHIIAKGRTPAGMHLPICVEEILSILDPKPGEVCLDATLGFGGHARRAGCHTVLSFRGGPQGKKGLQERRRGRDIFKRRADAGPSLGRGTKEQPPLFLREIALGSALSGPDGADDLNIIFRAGSRRAYRQAGLPWF